LSATQFLIPCRGHHVQTLLGVTSVVLVLVILRHCHAPLPADFYFRQEICRAVSRLVCSKGTTLKLKSNQLVEIRRGIRAILYRGSDDATRVTRPDGCSPLPAARGRCCQFHERWPTGSGTVGPNAARSRLWLLTALPYCVRIDGMKSRAPVSSAFRCTLSPTHEGRSCSRGICRGSISIVFGLLEAQLCRSL
jgi:hypothetical protein